MVGGTARVMKVSLVSHEQKNSEKLTAISATLLPCKLAIVALGRCIESIILFCFTFQFVIDLVATFAEIFLNRSIM